MQYTYVSGACSFMGPVIHIVFRRHSELLLSFTETKGKLVRKQLMTKVTKAKTNEKPQTSLSAGVLALLPAFVPNIKR